jgi:DinB superfamily
METTQVALGPSVYQLESILKLNDRLFINALADVTDEQANQRLTGHNNPLIWIATHTVWSRYMIAMLLGKPAKNPYEGMFENFKAYDEKIKYPTLENLRTEWIKTSGILKEAFTLVTEEQLAADSPLKSPIGDFTNAGTIAFLVQHESYDIGQMGFLKKYFTKEAMSYN